MKFDPQKTSFCYQNGYFEANRGGGTPPKRVVFWSFWPFLGHFDPFWVILTLFGSKMTHFYMGVTYEVKKTNFESKNPIFGFCDSFLVFDPFFRPKTIFCVKNTFFVLKTHFLCQQHIFLCFNTKFDILDEIFKNFLIFDNKIHFLLWINTICVWIHTNTKNLMSKRCVFHFLLKKIFYNYFVFKCDLYRSFHSYNWTDFFFWSSWEKIFQIFSCVLIFCVIFAKNDPKSEKMGPRRQSYQKSVPFFPTFLR